MTNERYGPDLAEWRFCPRPTQRPNGKQESGRQVSNISLNLINREHYPFELLIMEVIIIIIIVNILRITPCKVANESRIREEARKIDHRIDR